MSNIIEVRDVSFQYEVQDEIPVPILKGLNLSVHKGEFLALLGHNGSGKSTLAKLFNAMLVPTSGQVIVEGMDTADEEKRYDIRQTVGMVLQNPDNQLVATIVEDDVAFAPENLGLPPAEIRQRVDDALRTVDMYDYKDHAPHRLSGGQKQRVAIAGIIAMRPDCIVLDEPTAMLDPQGRKEVSETMHKLNKEFGITVILITHYMEEAVKADRVIVLDEGQIILEGTPREVFREVATLRAVQLDVPQTTRLLYRLRVAGERDLPDDVLTVNECADVLAQFLEEKECRS